MESYSDELWTHKSRIQKNPFVRLRFVILTNNVYYVNFDSPRCCGCPLARWGGSLVLALANYNGSWVKFWRDLDDEGYQLALLKTYRQQGFPDLPDDSKADREEFGRSGFPLAPYCPCGDDGDDVASLFDGSDDTGPILIPSSYRKGVKK